MPTPKSAPGRPWCSSIRCWSMRGPHWCAGSRTSWPLCWLGMALARSPMRWAPIFSRLRSGPMGEAQAGSCSRECAIAGRVVHPLQVEMLERAGGADPVANLGVSRIELLAGQRLERVGVFFAERANDAAIEGFIDRGVTEPAGGDEPDPQVLRVALDGVANG